MCVSEVFIVSDVVYICTRMVFVLVVFFFKNFLFSSDLHSIQLLFVTLKARPAPREDVTASLYIRIYIYIYLPVFDCLFSCYS